jgi:type IV pilus assembly protein PilB
MAIGQVAFERQLIDEGLSAVSLGAAKQHATAEKMQLADAVVALSFAGEAACYASLSKAIALPLVDVGQIAISELAVRLVSERLARRHGVVPIGVDNRTLTYATFRPFDVEAERDLSFAAGRRAVAVLATRSSILTALDRLYPKLQELERLAERLRSDEVVVGLGELGLHDVPGASPVIDLCNQLIGRAVELGASDLHVDCTSEGASVRFRICGVLEPIMTLPASASQPILNRFKIMAKADISLKFRPQDGAFRVIVNSRPIDVRLSTLPTVDGEKIVMRVIDSHSPLQGLDHLGYDEATLERLRKSLTRPDGLVLVTGPTGSGKTTALYAALGHLRTGQTNIVSVEDPVERTVAGVTQIPVNGKAGNTFPTILRSILRQDPNVIMVGEIRDAEVAQIVGQAAYTGHLVLSSLHTTDAASAVTRLMNLGLEPFKIAESLTAVLAQRLVRTLCPHCRLQHNDFEARRLGQAHNIKTIPASAGPGCEHCKQTGYLGRAPIAELLTPSDDLRAAIARGATSLEIRAAMHAAGMPSMRQQALALVAAGVTSMAEIDRVLAADERETAPARSGRRVLVCDDEPITRMLVKLLLEKEHFVVLEASTGREALDIARRERPDVLLIDLNMPEMNGYDAIAQIRRELTLTTMPIVVLTSEEGPGVERRVLDLGADDYIVKPFDAAVLLSRVHAVFRRLHAAVAA